MTHSIIEVIQESRMAPGYCTDYWVNLGEESHDPKCNTSQNREVQSNSEVSQDSEVSQ